MTKNTQQTKQKGNPLQKRVTLFPHQPGCYLFKDAAGLVLYVGKAKDLRKRVSQYFGQDKRPQLPFLIEDASDIDYIVARSELEALFLENTLIKKHNPKYNIKLKDDKNYAFIAIDYSTQIPQIGYVRKITDANDFTPFVNPSASWGSRAREQGRGYRLQTNSKKRKVSLLQPQTSNLKPNSYFGPYSSVKKIRETLDFVRKIFPYCANTEVSGRPCFYYHLHRCPGVCVGAVSLEEYQKSLSRIKLFLNGKTTDIKKELKVSMQQAAESKRFELAARLRDQLRALEILDERQLAQFPTPVDYDFISLATQNHLRCINLFKVRSGKLTDKENFIYNDPYSQTYKNDVKNTPPNLPYSRGGTGEGAALSSPPKIGGARGGTSVESATLQTFAEAYYAESTDLPAAIFTQLPPLDVPLLAELLRHRKGKKVTLSVPRRGKAHQLIKLGQVNAEEYLRKSLATDATDSDKLLEALQQLQELLKLPKLPKRIECYDMSNTQGTNPVGSMVVFVDGKPAKGEYRKFKIRSKDTPDDFAMMRETLARRLARVERLQVTGESKNLDSNLKPTTSNLTTWPRPDLIVIDGGKGQLSAALEAQEEVMRLPDSAKATTGEQVTDENKNSNSNLSPLTSHLPTIPMVGLAKRIEEIFLPHNPEPIVLSHDEPALQMLQRLRDEAHRFGITFHRSLRSKQATKSALDTIPGIGPKTKKLLKQKFGTVSAIKKATLEEIEEVVGKAKADIIKKNL